MSDESFELDVLRDLLEEAEIVGRLAKTEKSFISAFEAFRSEDRKAFQSVLKRLELIPFCRLVCEWIRIKWCALLCLELAGPPEQFERTPNPRVLAEAIVRITSDEKLVRQLAAAVEKQDRAAFQRLVKAHDLWPLRHLFCHWVCSVRYRVVCRWICNPHLKEKPDFVHELQLAGQAIGALLERKQVFEEAVAASNSGDAERLNKVVEEAGLLQFCEFICFFFCSWRCVLVCLRLCRAFPYEKVEDPLREAFAFARATHKLAQQPVELRRLSEAVGAGDAKAFDKLVKELELERFCFQLCHWLCFLRCRRFCFIVCPPRTIAVFTKIGGLYYDTAIDSHVTPTGTGLTVADKRAFFSTLRLNGGLSVVDGAPLVEYRFETITTSPHGTPTGTWTEVVPAQILPTNIGSFVRQVGPFFEVIEVLVNAPSGPGVFGIAPAADGWIKVPPMFPVAPMVTGTGWRFVPGSDLINFDTTTLAPSVVTVDETGVNAGSTANAPLQTDVHYGVRMRMRDQGSTGSGSDAGTCSHIAINNTRYDNISHHPYWPGGLFGQTHELAVASLGIQELVTHPCSVLKTLTVEFTAAHSNLGAVSIWLEGPGGPFSFALNPATAQTAGENWFGTATPVGGWTFSHLKPCAYLLKLSVQVLLTTGDAVPDNLVDYIAFCKG